MFFFGKLKHFHTHQIKKNRFQISKRMQQLSKKLDDIWFKKVKNKYYKRGLNISDYHGNNVL